MSLKPYPQYKTSGVAGSEYIPGDWDIVRNKYFLKERNIPSQDGTEELLTVSQYTGITKRRDRLTEESDLLTTAKTLEGYKTVHKEDMVMNIMLAWNGSLGVSQFNGIVSPAYCVFNANKKLIVPKYLHYLHRTKIYTGTFEAASTGVIKSRLRLYPDKYLALKSIIPPLAEQEQIARYLDWKTSQIIRFINAKKRQIELLKEQKQVIINDAVTGKINIRTGNPYPKYKDSGVEWLGMVPEGWRIIRNKYFLTERNEPSKDGNEELLTVSQYTGITRKKDKIMTEDEFLTTARTLVGYKKVEENDLVMNIMLAWNGSLGVSSFTGIVSPAYCVFRISTTIVLPTFLNLLHRSLKYIRTFETVSTGVIKSRLRLYPDSYFALKSFLPNISEQKEIVKWINDRINTIEKVILHNESEISIIKEYQYRLVSDVVTGKIDVRDIIVPDFNQEDVIADLEETSDSKEVLDESTVDNEI